MRISNGTDQVPVPARMDRAVLAHLALAQGRWLSVDALMEAAWGEHSPRGARNALQVKISRLRRLLGTHADALEFAQGAYRLRLAQEQVDVGLFERYVAEARACVDAGAVEDARHQTSAALELWEGTPFADLDEHPRLVAARARCEVLRLTAHELVAETELATGTLRPGTVETLRANLDHSPLRPQSRLLLMRALDASGRRAEALAVYDAGRRLLAETSGLEPPAHLQEAFEQLLAAERRAARRAPVHLAAHAAPSGALETVRWLAAEGEPAAAIRLAIRGAWWWWFAGERSTGRELFEELLGASPEDDLTPDALRASAWRAVFEAEEADAAAALARGERVLREALALGWGKQEALAAALLAERLFQRGDHLRARDLLDRAHARFAAEGDLWGMAVAGVIDAKATMLRGRIHSARKQAWSLLADFEDLGDIAGQVMALDVAGYCTEVEGDLAGAARIHDRALELARRADAPEWQASQLTRIGSVGALTMRKSAGDVLAEAADIAGGIRSGASLALARNALGLHHGLEGDRDEAVSSHRLALEWYERQESKAGISYTAGRLAVEVAPADPDGAVELAERSLSLAVHTSDPRAVAHALESLAHVTPDPVVSARALGRAGTLRRQTHAPLPAAISAQLGRVAQRVAATLGEAFATEVAAGEKQKVEQAT